MKTIQVFDPALCCSSGVCGVDVEQALVSFAADVDWAQARGARIQRFNLAQQPMAFVDHAAVKAALEHRGESALPLLLQDGQVMLSGRYPSRAELSQWLALSEATPASRLSAIAVAVAPAPASACCSPAPAGASSQAPGASPCC